METWRVSDGGLDRRSHQPHGARRPSRRRRIQQSIRTPDGIDANNLSSWNTGKIDDRNENEPPDSEPRPVLLRDSGQKADSSWPIYDGNVHLILLSGHYR
ncbi:MAG: hypothetical protein ACLR8Y_09850 [Alistipes indistinctus]